MTERKREAVLARLNEIQRLMGEIRDLCPAPNVESALRFAELSFKWVKFCLGGSHRFEFENNSFEPESRMTQSGHGGIRGHYGIYSAAAQNSPYWDPFMETLPREQLDVIHLRRLRGAIRFAYDHVPMYREIYDRANVRLDDIRRLDDYANLLPTLDKSDALEFQQRNPPYRDTVIRGSEEHASLLFQSSGTMGTPLLEPGSIIDATNLWEYTWWAYGIRPSDVFFTAFNYGVFMGFWVSHYDVLMLGAQAISGGGADSKTRMQLIDQLKPTVLVATPSYALRLAEVGKEIGIDPRASSIRFVFTAGEAGPTVPFIRKALEEAWAAKAVDIYAVSDVWGCPSWQCPNHPDRLHFTEACGYPLVVDNAGRPVANGEAGELVVTSYRSSIQPMIKYRTRDIVEWHQEGCDCGRSWTWFRGGVLARTYQMAIVKGTNVFPTAVQAVIGAIPGLSENLEIHITRSGLTDAVSVKVEPAENVASHDYPRLQQRAEAALKDKIRVTIPVMLVPPRSLPRYEFKAKRVIDHRVKEGPRQ